MTISCVKYIKKLRFYGKILLGGRKKNEKNNSQYYNRYSNSLITFYHLPSFLSFSVPWGDPYQSDWIYCDGGRTTRRLVFVSRILFFITINRMLFNGKSKTSFQSQIKKREYSLFFIAHVDESDLQHLSTERK